MKKKTNKHEIVSKYCKKGKILDVGFSANPNIFLNNCFGIDIKLPSKLPKNYRSCKICNLNYQSIPFENNFFNNVILGDVIEHVENPSHLLRECNRVLKMSGRLIISTPHANDWWTILHNWFFKSLIEDIDKGEHISNWTILDMHRLLKKNGFKIIHTYGYYFRTPFRKPFTLLFNVKYLPQLSWQVFYIVEKIKEPNSKILININNTWEEV